LSVATRSLRLRVGIIVSRFKYSGDPSFKKALTELQHSFADKQLSDELKRCIGGVVEIRRA
jgi:hypothetical protein